MIKVLFLISVLKLALANEYHSVPECSDFKPIEDGNLEEMLIKRWNLVRFYGMPAVPDNRKCSCIIVSSTPTEEDHKMLTVARATDPSGEVKNFTGVGTITKNNAALDITLDREFDVGGMKMTVHFHTVYTIVLIDDEVALYTSCYDHPKNKNEFFQTAGIFSRNTTQPSEAFIEKTEKIIESYGIATTFTEILHEDCQY